jgi:hypothetical protein
MELKRELVFGVEELYHIHPFAGFSVYGFYL